MSQADIVIIGGGIMGCSIALHLAQPGRTIILIEQADSLLAGASWYNQARVHSGYHYPRSYLTGLRSRVNYPRFIERYNDCIDHKSNHHYAISRHFSNVTGDQFATFCKRIGAPLKPAAATVSRLFASEMIEQVFSVEEAVFDASLLRTRISEDLSASGVTVALGTQAHSITSTRDGELHITTSSRNANSSIGARRVFNCTYSNLNTLLTSSGLDPIPLRHEHTEMAVVEVPDELKNMAVTVMCGPFFSLMPFPPLGLHTLSHVRYTPHTSWTEGPSSPNQPPPAAPQQSRFTEMILDSRRYLPPIANSRQTGSMWQTKTVLPRSDIDDSRPILFKRNHGLPGLSCVLGAKIDNIFDVLVEIDLMQAAGDL